MSVGPLRVQPQPSAGGPQAPGRQLAQLRRTVRRMLPLLDLAGLEPAETDRLRLYCYQLYERLRSSDLLARLQDGPELLPDIREQLPDWQRRLLEPFWPRRPEGLLRLLVCCLDWYLLPGRKPSLAAIFTAIFGRVPLELLIRSPIMLLVLVWILFGLSSALFTMPALLVAIAWSSLVSLELSQRSGLTRCHCRVLLTHLEELQLREEI
ncbi:hypothetical protein IT575_10650 [bacterium]|nr:hypothetical protein [bacterium]